MIIIREVFNVFWLILMPLVAKHMENEPIPYAQVPLCRLLANSLASKEKSPNHNLKITAERFAYCF